MLTAAQDAGAPGVDNINCQNTTHPVFAIYPASSPYMTAIGGTTLTPPSAADARMKRDVAQSSNLPICKQGFFCVNGPVTEVASMNNNTYVEQTLCYDYLR